MNQCHTWQIVSHARPTFCNVCREALVGVTSHGLSCGVCKLKAHKNCAAYVVKSCKWTTIESVDISCLSCSNDSTTIHHQWLEGNLPVSAKCVVCDKTCGSVLRLQDWRCLWCRATVHSACRSQFVPHCSLGPTRHATVPPTCLSHNKETEEWKVMHPFPGSPLIVFVNSKSGNGHGDRFLIRLKQFLNPSQVYDLSPASPKKGLQIFQHLAPLRLLVCGGDGSISWVLKEIDVLRLKAERVSVSVLPLGTGNDLARVCGWGAAIEADVNIINLLEKYDVGTPRLLDRWSIMSVETKISDCLPEDDENELNDRKGSIFGTTGTEVIRDISDTQLISHEDLEFEDDLDNYTLDRMQLCKNLSDLRGELSNYSKFGECFGGALDVEGIKERLGDRQDFQECILVEIIKVTDLTLQGTNESSSLNQMASELQGLVFEYMPEDNIRCILNEKSQREPKLQRSKSKDLKEAENLSMKSFEQDVRTLQCQIDFKSLDKKLKDFEQIINSSLNPMDSTECLVDDNYSHRCKDSSDKENVEKGVSFEDEVPLRESWTPEADGKEEGSKYGSDPPLKSIILTGDNEDEDDLLSNLSPIPSPVERSFSLTGHAKELPVPEAFSDLDEGMRLSEALAQVDDNKMKTLLCPEIMISSPSDCENEEKGDLSKDDAGGSSSVSPVPLTPEVPKSRRPSRFAPSGGGALSSVPEDGQLSTYDVSSPDNSPGHSASFAPNTSISGCRRLSVGAMVSLPTLLTGEATSSKAERSGSTSSLFNNQASSISSSSSTTARPPAKAIPIINPLVKTPNWPNMDKNPNAGIISMVVLASADALCAPVTPIMDWTPPPEKMKETSVMNNYFGIGIDAKISLDFHNKREQKPQGHRSRTKNYLWYGMLGSKELLQKTYKNLEKRVVLECDGEPIPLPSLQGIVVLNIKSFMGGTNFWGSAKDDNIFLPPNFDDGILEIVAVFGSMHMGASRIMNLQRHRIAQCRSVVIRILGKEGVPVQVDGEAWVHPPGIIRILHKNRVQLVTRDKSMEQKIRNGTNSRTLYREHAHPVLLPLDQEESQLLRSVIAAAKQLQHYLSLLLHIVEGKENHDLDTLIYKLQESIASVSLNDLMSVEAYELRRRCASFVNILRKCIAKSKKSLVENLQEEASSEFAPKLSQSIYTVESLLGKCHEEGELLFFTIRDHDSPEQRKSWFRVPKFVRPDTFGRRSSVAKGFSGGGSSRTPPFNNPKTPDSPSKLDSGCLVEVVLQWTPQNVSQWLESIGLPMYCHAFLEHEISGSELLSLERRDFKDVGVSKVGHIKRLQQGIKDINEGKMPTRLLQNLTMCSSQSST